MQWLEFYILSTTSFRETSFKGMSVDLKKSGANGSDKPTVLEEQQEKVLIDDAGFSGFTVCLDLNKLLEKLNWFISF